MRRKCVVCLERQAAEMDELCLSCGTHYEAAKAWMSYVRAISWAARRARRFERARGRRK